MYCLIVEGPHVTVYQVWRDYVCIIYCNVLCIVTPLCPELCISVIEDWLRSVRER